MKLDDLLELDAWRCVYCGRDFLTEDVRDHRDVPSLDHVISRHHGGPDEDWNAALACFSCNSSKRHRFGPAAHAVLVRNLAHTFTHPILEERW